MRYADLHTHTYHSDGTRSPKEVIDVVLQHDITIVAISDHDNLAAYYEIKPYADEQEVTLIPAIELSCGVNGVDVHILAYAFDAHDARIDSRLRDFREMRQRRGYLMVERLCAMGRPITAERVDQLAAGGAVGRPHVARALVEAGFASSVADAFDKFIGTGGPAYVEKERFDLEEAVAMIKSAGGLTSVAHPSIYPNHETLIPTVLDAGVDGIEVFHPDMNEPNRQRYSNLARFRGLMMTGGSDDHGTVKQKQTLGTIRLAESQIQPILDRI